VDNLDEQVIRLLAESICKLPEAGQRSVVEITLLGGAIAAPEAEKSTAWINRQANYEVLLVASWEEETDDKLNNDWMSGTMKQLAPFAQGGASGWGGEQNAKAAYGYLLPKLQQLKKKYDPTNLFNNNLNIPLPE
jgi:hypothetical protein